MLCYSNGTYKNWVLSNILKVVVFCNVCMHLFLLFQPMLHPSSSPDSVLFHNPVSISSATSGPQTPLHHLPVTLPLTQTEPVLPPASSPPSPKATADKLLVESVSPSVGGDVTTTPAEMSTSSSPPAVVKQEILHEDVTDDEAPVKTSTPSPSASSAAAVNGLKPGLEDITDDEADVKPDKTELKTEIKEEIETTQRSPKVEVKTEPDDPADGSSFTDMKAEVKEEDSSANKSSVSDDDTTKSTDVSRTSLLEEEGGRKGILRSFNTLNSFNSD